MVKLGVLCPAEIAARRFMPAVKQVSCMEYVGLAMYSSAERFVDSKMPIGDIQQKIKLERDKADVFLNKFGGKLYESYEDMITDEGIEAVYIPLPPGLHYCWAKKALERGKHVLVEKPCTLSYNNTKKLVDIAKRKNLAFHENYMFLFHKQIEDIKDVINSGQIGAVRLIRAAFGFPRREKGDFRYDKDIGGGGIADAGGYVVWLGRIMLGGSIKLMAASVQIENGVDICGAGTFVDDNGLSFQFAYGMDNDYKCELEIWGSKGTLFSGRVFTAPADYEPSCMIKKNGKEKYLKLSSDDSFLKSIDYFSACIDNSEVRNKSYNNILEQAERVEAFRKMAGI